MKTLISFLGLLILSCSCVHSYDTPSLPSRDTSVVLPLLKKLHVGDSLDQIVEILGAPDGDIGSGISIRVYRLSDYSRISVGSSDMKNILYIYRDSPLNRKKEVIHKEKIKSNNAGAANPLPPLAPEDR